MDGMIVSTIGRDFGPNFDGIEWRDLAWGMQYDGAW